MDSNKRPAWMPEDESEMVAEGLGYPDEQRTSSLDTIALFAQLLRGVEPWRLTPHTSGLFEIERGMAYLLGRVSEGPGGEDALTRAEEALGGSAGPGAQS